METDSARGRGLALPVLLLAPLLLVGPVVLAGERFLPFHPVILEPLASEHPEAAARARERISYPGYDRVFPTLTDQLAMRAELAAGRLPTWAPDVALGATLFAESIAGPAYPPNWIGLAAGPAEAAGPLAILSLVLAGLGVWLFLGRLGLSIGARAVGVLAMQLGGYGIQNLLDPMKVDAALWLPWQLWAIEGIARGRRAAGIALALAVALPLLAGFPQVALLALAASGIYAVVRLGPFRRRAAEQGAAPLRPLLLALAFLVLGTAGGALQLLPTAEASAGSLRTLKSAAELRAEALPPSVALGAAFPSLFAGPWEPPRPAQGTPAAWWLTPRGEWERTQHANAIEWSAYAGALVLLLAAAGAAASPRRAAFPLAGLLVSFLFAAALPPAAWLFHVPGLGVGAPGRVVAVAWTLWAWIAALGADALVRRRPRALPAFAGAALLLLAGAAWLRAAADPETFPRALEDVLVERYEPMGRTIADVRAVVDPADARATAVRLLDSATLAGGIALAALVLALAWRFALRRGGAVALGRLVPLALAAVLAAAAAAALAEPAAPGPALAPVLAFALGAAAGLGVADRRLGGPAADHAVWLPLAALLLVEGLAASRGWIVGQEAEPPLFPPSEGVDAIARAAGGGRVLRVAPDLAGIEGLARPNLLQPYGVSDLAAWILFMPREPVELVRALEPRSAFRTAIAGLPDASRLDAPLLDLLRVSAVLSTAPLEHPALEPVLERPGFHVHRRAGALPPARLVGEEIGAASDAAAVEFVARGALDPARQAVLAPGSPPRVHPRGAGRAEAIEVARPARNRVDVRVTGGTGGLLVVHEQYDRGWKASVNGEDAEILRADHAYRGIRVPPGDVVVRTWYEPWSLRFGAAASLLALAGAALLAHRVRP